MKNLLILSFLFLVSCKTTQPAATNAVLKSTVLVEVENCPENGNCLLELIPNKTIEFKTNGTGSLYPVITDGTQTLLKYTFIKDSDPEIADSDYTEIIYAELDQNLTSLTLTNETLSKAKLYYGRLCFCRDNAGYFEVKNGSFQITNFNNETLKIDLNFSVKKIPQLISEIHETVSLK